MRSAPLALALVALTGCGASEIEPRSPASAMGDAWNPFRPDLEALAPPEMRGPGDPPLLDARAIARFEADPAPIHERPRSISLGYCGDAPLTPSEPTAPRWPWIAEPLHNDRWVYGRRRW